RLLERDHEEDVQAASEWGRKALAASRKADELRTAGHIDEADKFDNRAKSAELVARQKTAEAQNKVADAVKSIDVMDPTSELGRFEQKIRREEALATGKQELAASSLDAQFNQLDDMGELTEIEARLAALKAGGAPARGAIDASTGS